MNQVLTPHTPYFEEMSTVYPHEIVVSSIKKEDDKFMHVIAYNKCWSRQVMVY